MKKYIRYYEIGFEDGVLDAIRDIYFFKSKKFKIDDLEMKSKLYDSGYIDGYNIFYSIIKKYLSFNDKI
jgi:hypothetical protein